MQEGLVHTLTTPTADCSLQLLPGDHHLWTHGSQSRGTKGGGGTAKPDAPPAAHSQGYPMMISQGGPWRER